MLAILEARQDTNHSSAILGALFKSCRNLFPQRSCCGRDEWLVQPSAARVSSKVRLVFEHLGDVSMAGAFCRTPHVVSLGETQQSHLPIYIACYDRLRQGGVW
jgi:hypothetical protein